MLLKRLLNSHDGFHARYYPLKPNLRGQNRELWHCFQKEKKTNRSGLMCLGGQNKASKSCFENTQLMEIKREQKSWAQNHILCGLDTSEDIQYNVSAKCGAESPGLCWKRERETNQFKSQSKKQFWPHLQEQLSSTCTIIVRVDRLSARNGRAGISLFSINYTNTWAVSKYLTWGSVNLSLVRRVAGMLNTCKPKISKGEPMKRGTTKFSMAKLIG